MQHRNIATSQHQCQHRCQHPAFITFMCQHRCQHPAFITFMFISFITRVSYCEKQNTKKTLVEWGCLLSPLKLTQRHRATFLPLSAESRKAAGKKTGKPENQKTEKPKTENRKPRKTRSANEKHI